MNIDNERLPFSISALLPKKGNIQHGFNMDIINKQIKRFFLCMKNKKKLNIEFTSFQAGTRRSFHTGVFTILVCGVLFSFHTGTTIELINCLINY